jgi:hypothetical protein
MKLKAPLGVGDPCVAGVAVTAYDGIYDVEESAGAVLVECFGFIDVSADEPTFRATSPVPSTPPGVKARRRSPRAKSRD